MIPIYRFGPDRPEGYSVKSFRSNLIGICEAHREDKRATAFGLILHRSTDPAVSKVLSDRDYWVALDRICGNALSVFAIHSGALPQEYWWPSQERADAKSHDQVASDLLAEYFENGVNLPALLFFQVKEERISSFMAVVLKAPSVEECFIELRDVLYLCAEAVRDDLGRPDRKSVV